MTFNKLNSLINNPLELAQINKNTEIIFSDVRIDEIAYNTIHEIRNKYHGRKIVPKIVYVCWCVVFAGHSMNTISDRTGVL